MVRSVHATRLPRRASRTLASRHRPHRSAYTFKEYGRIFEANIRPALGSVKLDKLVKEPDRIDAFYCHLIGRGLATASVRRHHALLHASLGRAVKWGMIPSNPADRATPPSLQRPTISAPDVTDVQRLISAAEIHGDSVLATAIALAAVTGCRRGELARFAGAMSIGRGVPCGFRGP